MFRMKKGIKLDNMDSSMGYVTLVVDDIFRTMLFKDCVITSAFRLGDKGRHGEGKALDFRAKHLDKQQKDLLLAEVKERLPISFYCLIHGEGDNCHLHIQKNT